MNTIYKNIPKYRLKEAIKEWGFGIGLGGVSGGVIGSAVGLGLGGRNLFSKNSWKRDDAIEQLEILTLVGGSTGILITGTIVNPVLTGISFIGSITPIYLYAKFKQQNAKSIRYFE